MVGSLEHAWQPRRLVSLAATVLLLAVVATALSARGSAKDPKDEPPKPDKNEATKTEVRSAQLAPAPTPPRNQLAPKAESDVAEMVKLINDRLAATWVENKVVPTRYVDDYEFIRRVSLDIIGRIAKPAEIVQFMKDPRETRRAMLVERLLANEEYPKHWANVWANWLLGRAGVFGRGKYHDDMSTWLEDQFALNRPYSHIVRDLLTASGDNSENGAVNFILAHLGEAVPPAKGGEKDRRIEEGQFEMVPITSRITRIFLGTQVQCAQCHDHPFQKSIKQDRFWGVNAFLRQVERVGNPPVPRGTMAMTYGKLVLRDNPRWNSEATVFYEKRNGVVLQTGAEFLPATEGKKPTRLPAGTIGKDRRERLAEYVEEHDNFPKAVVNRMWSVFFGRGFVNPVDDFNDNNQPSDPELLNELAARFKHYNYDMKKLIRWICNSNAYQLSYVANRTNDKPEHEPLFSRMVLKSMSPEQLFESLMVATNAEAAEKKEDKKKLRDQWMSRLIANFGDDEGNEVNFNGTVVQALLMMNGEDINTAINRKEKGTVSMAISKSGLSSPAGIIRHLYLASLNREPTSNELQSIAAKVRLRPGYRDRDVAAPYYDVFWALLNSSEFLLNH
jgi:Protein of unknown function (DUF1549)/Protein of unknown function (DUF1553)